MLGYYSDHDMDAAADTILWPKLVKLLREYPEYQSVCHGEQVAKDMIAVPIGPDTRMAVVGAPSYFKKRSPPKTPQVWALAGNVGLDVCRYSRQTDTYGKDSGLPPQGRARRPAQGSRAVEAQRRRVG